MEESLRYRCENRTRADKLREHGPATVNGIDYLEVVDNEAPGPSPPQRTLLVHLFQDLPWTTAITVDCVNIMGGVKTQVNVEWVCAANALDGLVVEPPLSVEEKALYALNNKDRVLVVRTDSDGDFSTYTLRIQDPGNESAPLTGFDPVLFEVHFSFKVECPNEFDCQPDQACVDEFPPAPSIDYLAKDYNSFRQLMLDRMAVTNPQWKERHVPDLQLTLVELLAYAADRLSYFQDAVATEAYLSTARRRSSVRRHARLLNYPMHDGCNARTWLYLEVDPAIGLVALPQERGPFELTEDPVRFLSRTPGIATAVDPSDFKDILTAHPSTTVFELRGGIELRAASNEFTLHTWGAQDCCLPKGATWADLVSNGTNDLDNEEGRERLKGQFLLFEEVLGTSGDDQPDPAHRQVVRIVQVEEPVHDPIYDTNVVRVHWDDKDKLTFPLCLSVNGVEERISRACGNIVLADHGRTVGREDLYPLPTGSPRLYRPSLDERNVTFWQQPQEIPATDLALLTAEEREAYWRANPASGLMAQDPTKGVCAIELVGDDKTWLPRRDLLESDRFDTHFVVETESDGIAHLRFGDNVYGLKPDPVIFTVGDTTAEHGALYRIGNGVAGNLGAESIKHIVFEGIGIAEVRQPLPAYGGRDAESLEEVRQYAPQAFRIQKRAVTETDYADKAEVYPDKEHAQVQRAAATRRWTGSWYTMFVTADRFDDKPVDEAFENSLRDHLEDYRLAGHDLEVDAPLFVPLEIRMGVCVETGHFASDVKKRLLEVFSSTVNASGEKGFFHPDNYTFGQPVYLSRVIAKAMSVDGVRWVELPADSAVYCFKRWRRDAADEIDQGLIAMGRLEIAQLDNDPSRPENGLIEFIMH